MKARSSHRLLSLLVVTATVAAVTFPGTAAATPPATTTHQYWNPGGIGGDGVWGNSDSPADKNWNTTAGAPASGNTVWPDTGNEVAVFADGTGGTATVFTPVQAAGIIQQNANYIIDAETITLVPDSAAANPFIQVQPGTLTISSVLAGGNGLRKTGSGNLVLTGASTYAGTTALSAGTLTLTGDGSLASTTVDIAAGATLVDSNGGLAADTALTNAGTLTLSAPDSIGSFTQTASGTLASSATLTVTGTAGFGGTLQLIQVGPGAPPPFVPIHVVAAGDYIGNFATLVENYDGAVWFNPRNGDAIRLPSPMGNSSLLYGSTTNQSAAWVALYDDVIAPGVTNITVSPGGYPAYVITSGLADANNPDLLWALTASFTPAGLNAKLLNHLSPEVYAGLSDYAMQATRTHQRSAFSAPALTPVRQSDSKSDSKSGSKGGSKNAAPAARLQWEWFAATDYFHVQTSESQNQADYELNGFGLLGGARTKLTERIQLAAYLAGDWGDIDGSLIDADSTGWSLGLLGQALLDETTRTRLSAGISYGRYSFDGSRSSVAATRDGWSAAAAGFSDVAADSLELFVGVDSLVYHNDRFRLIPAFGLRAATGSMDGFTESTATAAGSAIALAVDEDHYNSLLADLSLLAEADVTNKVTVWGLLGVSAAISDDPHSLTARYAKGGRPFAATTDGLSNDSWFLGLGAIYKVSDSISVALGYRAEFRSDADAQSNVCLSSSFRF